MQTTIVDSKTVLVSRDPTTFETRNRMTLYEKTTLIGTRMEQLRHGAPSTLTPDEMNGFHGDLWKIVEAELQQNIIPLMICRTLPTGKKEFWKTEELIIP